MNLISKPWGKEEILEINDNYMLKKITMWKDNRCSLQYHNYKKETIYILIGKLRIYCGSKKDNLESRVFEPHESITIPSKLIHRMEAIEDSVYLEASTPELNDVVRLEDSYNRVST